MMEPQAQQLADAVAKAMFARDVAVQTQGITILETRPGYARATMRVRADMLNGHAICHGGIIFTLADSAFAYACNSYNRATVAAGASIDFLKPAHPGDELVAVATERSRAKRSGIYDVTVHNQKGEAVALFRGRSHELSSTVMEALAG